MELLKSSSWIQKGTVSVSQPPSDSPTDIAFKTKIDLISLLNLKFPSKQTNSSQPTVVKEDFADLLKRVNYYTETLSHVNSGSETSLSDPNFGKITDKSQMILKFKSKTLSEASHLFSHKLDSLKVRFDSDLFFSKVEKFNRAHFKVESIDSAAQTFVCTNNHFSKYAFLFKDTNTLKITVSPSKIEFKECPLKFTLKLNETESSFYPKFQDILLEEAVSVSSNASLLSEFPVVKEALKAQFTAILAKLVKFEVRIAQKHPSIAQEALIQSSQSASSSWIRLALPSIGSFELIVNDFQAETANSRKEDAFCINLVKDIVRTVIFSENYKNVKEFKQNRYFSLDLTVLSSLIKIFRFFCRALFKNKLFQALNSPSVLVSEPLLTEHSPSLFVYTLSLTRQKEDLSGSIKVKLNYETSSLQLSFTFFRSDQGATGEAAVTVLNREIRELSICPETLREMLIQAINLNQAHFHISKT